MREEWCPVKTVKTTKTAKTVKRKTLAIFLCIGMALAGLGGTAAAETELPEGTKLQVETELPEETEPQVETDSLYAHGLEVIALMEEMLRTEYPELMTTDEEILSAIQGGFGDDFSEPKAVYSICVGEDVLTTVEEFNRLEDASDDLKDYFMQKLLGSLVNRVNGLGGSADLAAASICTAEKLFVEETASENVIYLYTYDDAVPVAVTFLVGEDHAVSASGMFVLYEDFACGSAGEIKAYFAGIPVEVDEVRMK